ncbi:hypothetical protein [Arvimicrobium flavum]|uniref:hypothetical protein n=1 Tax=Arvimicrobium flavum TaxID=3393320 RepID=UPI00237AB28E|nr:hypothetical protein [Mesorhizobium shangrilense]
MAEDNPSNPTKSAAKANQKSRLGAELKANLMRRKAQVRARRTGEPDQRPEGLDPRKSASDQ